jgi:hypothetical protein
MRLDLLADNVRGILKVDGRVDQPPELEQDLVRWVVL